MEWIYLESFVALSIAVGIVWWSLAPVRKRRKREREAQGRREQGRR